MADAFCFDRLLGSLISDVTLVCVDSASCDNTLPYQQTPPPWLQTMSSAPKLTKKQKKALAFRDRGKGKGKAKSFDELDNDIPIEEDQDRADAALYLAEEVAGLEAQAGLPKHATKGSAQAEGESGYQDGQGKGKGKKRKREEGDAEVVKEQGKGEEDAAPAKKAKKKRKGVDGAAVDAGEDGGEDNVKKQKFILFVGRSLNASMAPFTQWCW